MNVSGQQVIQPIELFIRRLAPSALAVYDENPSLWASIYIAPLCVLPSSLYVFVWRHILYLYFFSIMTCSQRRHKVLCLGADAWRTLLVYRL